MQEHVRALRKNMTDAENRMWYFLRNRRLEGYKFLRQHKIDNYIVDFICRDKKLIIELDGGQHMQNADYDQKRTEFLIANGYTVLRFWNNEIFCNVSAVLERILCSLKEIPSSVATRHLLP